MVTNCERAKQRCIEKHGEENYKIKKFLWHKVLKKRGNVPVAQTDGLKKLRLKLSRQKE